jgi:hypothetical protein
MLEKLIYGAQWCLTSTLAFIIWGGICLLLLIAIQTIVYRTTDKQINLYKMLVKSLFK